MKSNKSNNSIIFLKDWKLLVCSMPMEDQLEFWDLFTSYEYGAVQICENTSVLPIWLFIKSQLDKMKEEYQNTVVSRNRENGSKGGRPKNETQKTQNNPVGLNETQKTPNENENVNEKDNDNDFLLEKETKGENQDFLQYQNSEGKETSELVNSESLQKEKSCAKKEKAQPPDLDTFIGQAREIYQNEIKVDFSPYEFAVRSKYQSWLDGGWKDGNKKPILNWINKLRNTIPHLKPIYGTHNTKQSNNNASGYSNGSNQLGKGGKITASQMVARAREEAITRHREGGN